MFGAGAGSCTLALALHSCSVCIPHSLPIFLASLSVAEMLMRVLWRSVLQLHLTFRPYTLQLCEWALLNGGRIACAPFYVSPEQRLGSPLSNLPLFAVVAYSLPLAAFYVCHLGPSCISPADPYRIVCDPPTSVAMYCNSPSVCASPHRPTVLAWRLRPFHLRHILRFTSAIRGKYRCIHEGADDKHGGRSALSTSARCNTYHSGAYREISTAAPTSKR